MQQRLNVQTAVAALMLAFSTSASAHGGGANGGDREPRVDNAVRNSDRIRTDADRAAARIVEERAKLDARAARDSARLEELRIKDPAKAIEEAAKIEADRVKAEQKLTEDAQKAEADTAEREAKLAEDAAKDSSGSGSGHDSDLSTGSSESMRDLATEENPEFDSKGFPAKRGELVALDMTAAARAAALARNFRIVSEVRLPALGVNVTRLAVPDGLSGASGLTLMRSLDAAGEYDLAHYYGLNIGTAGARRGAGHDVLAREPGKLRLGMIDTAIAAHPLLSGVRIEARAFGGGATMPTVHGTAVASLLATKGASNIVAASVFRGTGEKPFTSAEAIANGLEWLVASKVSVINISLTGPRNAVLDALVRRSIATGHSIVAAAGNGGPGAPPAYPAAIPGVIAVTAVDRANHVYRYANQGNYIAFAARGVDVMAAAPNGKLSGFTGTSFATPVVAARIARCAGRGGSADDCVRALARAAQDLGTPGRDSVYGFGVIPEGH